MRLLLILIFLTYANAKFGRSYRSSDTEVLPVPVKNVSSTTVDTIIVSLSPVTPATPTTTTPETVGNVSKVEQAATAMPQHDTENVHKKADELKVNTLKHTMERHHEKHAKSTEQHDKLKKAEAKSGNDVVDGSEEQSYDDIEERVEKELAEQYKDEDDYSSAEHQRTSSLMTTPETTSTAPAVTTITTRPPTTAITSTTASPTSVATTASKTKLEKTSKVEKTKKETPVSTPAVKLRTTVPKVQSKNEKVSRRNNNNDAVQISISMRTVEYIDETTEEGTLGKMDIGRRKTTRIPKTNTPKMSAAVEPQNDIASPNELAQPQKLSGIKNISDYQPRRVYETTTKRVIEILRTMKYRKNSAPGSIHNIEKNMGTVIILFLSFSVLAYAS